MRNFRNSLLVLSLFACVAGTSFADNSVDLVAQAAGPRQSQQGGPGGPGGPGGMQMRRMGPPMVILMDQKVQEHLKLTPQQIERLRTELAPPPGGPGGFGGPQGGQQGGGVGRQGQGGQQGGQQGGGVGRQGQGGPGGPGGPGMQGPGDPTQFDPKLKEILNDQQFKRYKELELQWTGVTAVMRPDVSATLKISDQQRQQIQQIIRESRPQGGGGGFGGPQGGQQGGGVGRQGQGSQGGQQGGGVGRQGQGGQQGGPRGFGDPAAMEKMRAELEKKILAVLTDAQRSQWTKMLGAKFEFTRMQQPPRPGGGGRGDGTLEF